MTTMRATRRHTKEVFTGRYIDYDDPLAEQISLDDIAHGLAFTCRYGGHTDRYYSVAEHAILVSSILMEQQPGNPAAALGALHHDDHEAYLGDLPTPLKNALGAKYDALRDKIDTAICLHLGLAFAWIDNVWVHRADAFALRMEARRLMPSRGEGPEWAPAWARWPGLADWHPSREGVWTPGLPPHVAEREYKHAHARLMREAKPWLPG
jgi:uncharacterized protein